MIAPILLLLIYGAQIASHIKSRKVHININTQYLCILFIYIDRKKRCSGAYMEHRFRRKGFEKTIFYSWPKELPVWI